MKIQPDDDTIPFTHEAKIGIVAIPKVGVEIEAILVEDAIPEHIAHLTKHFEDEATVTLTAYHKHTKNGLIFDLELGGKNYRYMFEVKPEMLGILNEMKSLVIYDSNNKQPLFFAYVGDCQNSLNELTAFIVMTERAMSKGKNDDKTL